MKLQLDSGVLWWWCHKITWVIQERKGNTFAERMEALYWFLMLGFLCEDIPFTFGKLRQIRVCFHPLLRATFFLQNSSSTFRHFLQLVKSSYSSTRRRYLSSNRPNTYRLLNQRLCLHATQGWQFPKANDSAFRTVERLKMIKPGKDPTFHT